MLDSVFDFFNIPYAWQRRLPVLFFAILLLIVVPWIVNETEWGAALWATLSNSLSWVSAPARLVSGFLSTFDNFVAALVVCTLAVFFPISVIAYETYQAPIRQERLALDFKLLFGQEAAENELGGFFYSRSGNYLLNVSLCSLTTVIGASLLFIGDISATVPRFVVESGTLTAMRYGFLGAYIFAVQLVYRRYTTFDLLPMVYLSCSVTIIAGLTFNYVAFEAVQDAAGAGSVDGAAAGLSAVISFSLGYFPLLGIRWFNSLAYAALGMRNRRAVELPLGLIDGIGQFHETRLRDSGIDNLQNLAAADIADLLKSTTFSAQQVIDWIDQAVLYLYLDEESIKNFRQAGVRTLSDFQRQWGRISKETPDRQEHWALQFQATPAKLQILYESTNVGPNAHWVAKYWEQAETFAEHARELTVAEFEDAQDELRLRAADRTGLPGLGSTGDGTKAPIESRVLDQIDRQGAEELLDVRALLGLANVQYQEGHLARAGRTWRKVLQADPENAIAANNLAYAAAVDQTTNIDHSGALELAQRAVDWSSEAPDKYTVADRATHLHTLAIVLTRLGRFDDARGTLARAANLDGLDPEMKEAIEGVEASVDEAESRSANTETSRGYRDTIDTGDEANDGTSRDSAEAGDPADGDSVDDAPRAVPPESSDDDLRSV